MNVQELQISSPVQHRFGIKQLPWYAGTYGNADVSGDLGVLTWSHPHTYWWFLRHFQGTSEQYFLWFSYRIRVDQEAFPDETVLNTFLNEISISDACPAVVFWLLIPWVHSRKAYAPSDVSLLLKDRSLAVFLFPDIFWQLWWLWKKIFQKWAVCIIHMCRYLCQQILKVFVWFQIIQKENWIHIV